MDFSSEADAGASGITSAHVKSLLDKLEAALDPYTSNAIRAFVLQNARLRENATHLSKMMLKRQQETYRHLTLAERVEQNQEEMKAVKAFVEEIERARNLLSKASEILVDHLSSASWDVLIEDLEDTNKALGQLQFGGERAPPNLDQLLLGLSQLKVDDDQKQRH